MDNNAKNRQIYSTYRSDSTSNKTQYIGKEVFPCSALGRKTTQKYDYDEARLDKQARQFLRLAKKFPPKPDRKLLQIILQ